MTIATQTTENKISPVNSKGNLAALVDPAEFSRFNDDQKEYFHFSTLLQSSLNTEEILTQFSREISQSIPHDSFNFLNESQNLNFNLGTKARHSCTYELTINNERLGILCLTRSQRFSRDEITRLENYICTLHYPLRNAIMYNEAVNAANKDPLTGIGNRAAMTSSVYREIEMACRHNRNLGVIMIDIDHFKAVNDQYGHLAGDRVLQSLVECIDDTVRITDLFFRYGGEEFAILVPETPEVGVLRLAKRIRRRVEKLVTQIQDHAIRATVSIGITNLQENDDEKSLFARADEALYKAKQEGRNCIRIATSTKV